MRKRLRLQQEPPLPLAPPRDLALDGDSSPRLLHYDARKAGHFLVGVRDERWMWNWRMIASERVPRKD